MPWLPPGGRKSTHRAYPRAKPMRGDRSSETSLSLACLGCGRSVAKEEVQAQYQADNPRPIPVTVTRFSLHGFTARHARCGGQADLKHERSVAAARRSRYWSPPYPRCGVPEPTSRRRWRSSSVARARWIARFGIRSFIFSTAVDRTKRLCCYVVCE